ncbi:MAG: DUF1918 domain-containing protein [Chloroflexota bacterium]
MTTTATPAAGDRISVNSNRAGESVRVGTILEVIEHGYGNSFRVAWEDGHESTIKPTAGSIHVIAEETATKR